MGRGGGEGGRPWRAGGGGGVVRTGAENPRRLSPLIFTRPASLLRNPKPSQPRAPLSNNNLPCPAEARPGPCPHGASALQRSLKQATAESAYTAAVSRCSPGKVPRPLMTWMRLAWSSLGRGWSVTLGKGCWEESALQRVGLDSREERSRPGAWWEPE